MSTAGHTPNFVAEEAIYPFRCVKVGTAPFKAVPSTANPEILLGVTDGSIQTFNGTYHATAGQTISLQNGEFVQLTASGSITVGDTLIATTDGKVAASVSATEYIAQAAENASDGEIFWAKKVGAWTVSGGGPSPIGGGWPAPDTKILWQTDFLTLIPSVLNDSPNASTPEYFCDENQGAGFSQMTKPSPWVDDNHAGIVALEAGGANALCTASMWVRGAPADLNTAACANLDVGSHESVCIYMLVDEASENAHSHVAGFLNSSGMSSGNLSNNALGVFFRYQPGENDNNWQCVVRYSTGFSGLETVVDSEVPGVGMNWVNLRIFITEGAAPNPLPTATFFINGTQVGSIDMNNPPVGSSFDFSQEYYVGAGINCHDEDGYAQSFMDYIHYLGLISR